MQPALLIRLRPTGPWRYGPGDNGHDRIDALYRSDRLFSAITLAMQRLGALEEWLHATARASKPAVTFTSLYPYQGDTLFATPPSTVWPPPSALLTTPSPVFLSKTRWSSAQFVPLSLIESLLSGQAVLADQWTLDAESGCLLRRDRPSTSPFRIVVRGSAAVDRIAQSVACVHSLTCVEFEPSSGLWCLGRYADVAAESTWGDRVKACFRILSDSGFGGKRSSGWGQAETPEFQRGAWPNLLVPKLARVARNGNRNGAADGTSLYWILSLYSPAAADTIDWSGGAYRVTARGGRIESAAGAGTAKKVAQMIVEGSVLATGDEPSGTAVDVAPDGFAHSVYRSGFAVALQLPAMGSPDAAPVEIPSDEEALEPRPCEGGAILPSIEEGPDIQEPATTPQDVESAESDDSAPNPVEREDSGDEL